jgi:exodeoxyribonuclease VII large subunit
MLQRAARSGRYDAILLARGGGSLEDLWAFNDERLVRAIVASEVPVVSAIGHETDFSLADFVADLRAPTPSVAAELLVPSRHDLRLRLHGLQRRLHALQGQRLRQLAQRADRAALRLHALRPQARLALFARRQRDAQRRLHAALRRQLDQRQARLRHADAVLRAMQPRRRLAMLRQRLEALALRPQAALARRLQHDAMRLRGLARSLETVSPLATVARGYAILQHVDGRVVRGISEVAIGDALDARVADGLLHVRVESKS